MYDKVPGYGPERARIIVVGEAPAREEMKTGKPFQGRAGQEMTRLFEGVGINRDECYITNASLVPVQGDKKRHFFGADGKPTPAYIEGIGTLYEDIQRIKPNVVIALGNYALWALRQHQEVMTWRGSILWSDLMNVKVIPTLHPSALLQGNPSAGFSGLWKWRPIVILDLLRAKEQSKFPELRLTERQLLILEDLNTAEAQDALKRLRAAKQLTFDIETFGGLNLACVGFGDEDPTWAACIPYLGNPRHLAVYQELLGDTTPKVGQNLMYDVTALDQLGIHTANVQYDTMIAQGLLLTDLPKGLDFQASIYTDIPYYKDEGKIWRQKSIKDYRQFWEYNAKDVCATTASRLEQLHDFEERPEQLKVFQRSMRLFEVLRDATYRGWDIDRDELLRLKAESEAKRDAIQAELNKAAGYDFNPRSPVQVKELVYEVRKLPVRTKNKKVTADEGALMDLAAKHEDKVPYLIVRVRKQAKLLSNYYHEGIISPDGRVRTTYNIVGTKTGRLSSSAPLWGPGMNQQNIPKKSRKLFRADKGCEIGTFDQVQAEAVVTAYLALDPIHMDCFRSGKDVHRVTACLLADAPIDDWQMIPKDSPARDIAKRCNHAFNYGMGPVVFMLTVNKYWDPEDPKSLRLDQSTATSIYEKYHATRPALQGYWRYVANLLKATRILITTHGRDRMFLDRWSDTMLKDAYSWIPQSTVGDNTNIGILRVADDYELQQAGVQFMTQTHDSGTWQWPIENREFVSKRIMQHMEVELHLRGYRVIVPIEGGCGPTWGASCDPKDPGYVSLGVSRTSVEL